MTEFPYPPGAPDLYGMADDGVDPAVGDVEAQARRLAEAGVPVVQLRCKHLDDAALLGVLERLRGLGPRWVVNDRVEVARRAGAWVHLGQEDGPAPSDLPHGRSCHTIEQVIVASRSDPRPLYLGFGPVFGTTSKHSPWPARGLGLLAEACAATELPVVAIGGITPEALPALRRAGVAAWAVIGGVWGATDVYAALRRFRGGMPSGH